jgi:hypothetical protein
MPAECWGCAAGLARIGNPLPNQGNDPPEPLGSCFDCRVFGCSGHAERGKNSGKWLCFPTIAKALATSATVIPDDGSVTTKFATVREFEEEFPELGAAISSRRLIWDDRMHGLLSARPELQDRDRRQLAGAAAAVVELLTRERRFPAEGVGRPAVAPTGLEELMREAEA